jgi:hypothetical protein
MGDKGSLLEIANSRHIFFLLTNAGLPDGCSIRWAPGINFCIRAIKFSTAQFFEGVDQRDGPNAGNQTGYYRQAKRRAAGIIKDMSLKTWGIKRAGSQIVSREKDLDF